MIQDNNRASDSEFTMDQITIMYNASREAREHYDKYGGDIIPPSYTSLEEYINVAVRGWADMLHGDVVIVDEDGVEIEGKRFRGGLKQYKPNQPKPKLKNK